MPVQPPRICSCGQRVAYGARCVCQARRRSELDTRRPSAADRGYDARWRTESRAFLALPHNRKCACGCGRDADMVDHIIPHRGDKRLFWDRSNWQPMATSPCHNSRKQRIEKRADRGWSPTFQNRSVTGHTPSRKFSLK